MCRRKFRAIQEMAGPSIVDLENRFCLSYLSEFDRLITALKVRKFPFLEVSPIITIMSMLTEHFGEPFRIFSQPHECLKA